MGEGDITFDILLKKYKYHVSAEALFFASGHNKALRVEAPTLNKEFTDGAYIGADPKGFLFYKDTTSFDGSTLKYTVSKISSSGTTYAHIKFYHDSPTDYYIEFLAEDPEGAVTGAGMNGYTSSGQWNDLKITATPATVKKYDDKAEIYFTVDTIHLTATITDSKDVLKNKAFVVEGTFYFKDINTIKNGTFANYNNDRIVFYQNNYTGKDFTGYFIPFQYSTTSLGIPTSNTQTFNGTKWASK